MYRPARIERHRTPDQDRPMAAVGPSRHRRDPLAKDSPCCDRFVSKRDIYHRAKRLEIERKGPALNA